MDIENKIDELLTKYDYMVSVRLKDDKIEINYAGQKVLTYCLSFNDDYACIQNNRERIFLPLYLVRLFILCSIYQRCRRYGLSYGLIRFYDKDGNKSDILKLIPVELSVENAEKERTLNDYATKVLSNSKDIDKFDKKLEQLDLFNSFVLLKGLLI